MATLHTILQQAHASQDSFLYIPAGTSDLDLKEHLDELSRLAPFVERLYIGSSEKDSGHLSDLSPFGCLRRLTLLLVQRASIASLEPFRDWLRLERITVDGGTFSDVSPLAGLTALQLLSLNDTAVSDLSPLAGLTTLQILAVRRTAVSDLSSLAGLTALQALRLSGTAVSDLSPLAGLTALQALSLSGTAVSDLSPLAGLTALQSLSLNDTAVSDLSPLAGLTALQALSLNGTAVRDLSPLLALRALGRLSLFNISNLSLPSELLATREASAIFRHIRDGLSKRLVPLAEAIVQVVGEPGVGKSWLCNRVFRDRPNPPGGERDRIARAETHDYEIIHLDKPMDVGGLKVNVRIRDFGGQHVLHGVHELFLSQRCLYLLVLNAARGKAHNKINYWLKLIRHMAGDSPVLLAVTQCDQQRRELGKLSVDELAKITGANITSVVEGLSTWAHLDEKRTWYHEQGKGRELLDEIAARLADLGAVHDKVSPAFAEIRDAVEHMLASRALVALAEYRAACEQAGIRGVAEQDAYLDWLRHLGVVGYFGLLEPDRRRAESHRRRTSDETPSVADADSVDGGDKGDAGTLPPGALRLLDIERHAELENWLVNVQWLKWPLYEIIRESERSLHHGVLSRSVIDDLTSKGDMLFENEVAQASEDAGAPPSILPADEAPMRRQVVRGTLDLIGLAIRYTGPERYLFPRGLSPNGEAFRLGTELPGKPTVLRWDFLPEAALHRFLVRVMRRGEVRNNRVWRYGGVLELVAQGQRILVTVEGVPDAGELRLWFHEKDPVMRDLATALVRTAMVDELGCPPASEPTPPKPLEGPHLSASRRRAWEALDRFIRETRDVDLAYPTLKDKFAQMMRMAEYRELLGGLKSDKKGFENFAKYIRDAKRAMREEPGGQGGARNVVRVDEI